MKAVLISIRPKWCEKIPAVKRPLKSERPSRNWKHRLSAMSTAQRKWRGYDTLWVLDAPSREKYSFTAVSAYLERPEGASEGNRKVIGEFTCDAITRVNLCGFWDDSGKQLDNRLKETCLTSKEFCDYLGEKVGYGWHISNLKIYDTPRELDDFRRECKNDWWCESCAMYSVHNGTCGNGSLQIRRPPQSWCYVEEQTWED